MLIIDAHGQVHTLPFGLKSAADLQKQSICTSAMPCKSSAPGLAPEPVNHFLPGCELPQAMVVRNPGYR
jgi:hypothetical protein